MDRNFRNTLRVLVSGPVFFDEPMGRHTSIGVGGKAEALVFPKTKEELESVLECIRRSGTAFLPVGNCTNLIVRDGGFKGVLISMREMRAKRLQPEGGNVMLYAEAGVAFADIVSLTADQALTGLEFCAGIPGTVGGGVKMNAGAYGREIKDVTKSVSLMNGAGFRSIERSELAFSYRHLELPKNAVIVEAMFMLQRSSIEKVSSAIGDIIALRTAKHPLRYRNAGSVFKNPKPETAGHLIEEAGMKGIRVGDAMVSQEHGNFIVNLGRATAHDILSLIEQVEDRVCETFGVRLEREVQIIGEEAS
jgi:UDP-N-acetylmuramate dehydrogenase